MAALMEPVRPATMENELATSMSVENDSKRARSETPERQSKRQRMSASPSLAPSREDNSATATQDAKPQDTYVPNQTSAKKSASPAPKSPSFESPQQTTKPSNRVRKRVDEGQRVRRLFGALLTLDHKPDEKTSRQRREIELRKKTELQQQDDRRAEHKQRNADQLRQKRRRSQQYVSYDPVSIRHDNLIHKAHFLRTRTEPRLYYLPWTLRPEEEDCIDDQIAEARDTVEREKAQHKADKERRRSSPGIGGPDSVSRNGEHTRSTSPSSNALPDSKEKANREQKTGADGGGRTSETEDSEIPIVPEHAADGTLAPEDVTKTDPITTATTSSSSDHEADMEDGDEDTVLY